MEPVSARNAAERLAAAIMHALLTTGITKTGMIRGANDIVLIGDFLDDINVRMEQILPLTRHGLRGHVVEIANPAEETLPYSGHTEFTDPQIGDNAVPILCLSSVLYAEHTPGHSGIILESEGQKIVFWGDITHVDILQS